MLAPPYYLDQSITKGAIKDFQLFITRYPNSVKVKDAKECIDKLTANLEKDFTNSKLYYDIKEYKAAIVSLNNFIKDYPASKFKEEAQFYLCLSHFYYALNSVADKQLPRFLEAIDVINNFTMLYPDSQYANKLNLIKAEIENKLNQNKIYYEKDHRIWQEAVTRDIKQISEITGNIYLSTLIIGKRANQISQQTKEELDEIIRI